MKRQHTHGDRENMRCKAMCSVYQRDKIRITTSAVHIKAMLTQRNRLHEVPGKQNELLVVQLTGKCTKQNSKQGTVDIHLRRKEKNCIIIF